MGIEVRRINKPVENLIIAGVPFITERSPMNPGCASADDSAVLDPQMH
jgi:hypothetical protein